jgi:putative transcriptional regulator
MAPMNNVANQILIAMPSSTRRDPYFDKTVIYVCEHHATGSVGLIINKPMKHPLSLVFEQLKVKPIHVEQQNKPLLFGGPMQPERGFVIHKEVGAWRSSLRLREDVTITTSNDIIRAMAADTGPTHVLVTLGYVGWMENQLEKEIADNHWLVCPFSQKLIYEVPFEQRWVYAGFSIGVNMLTLTSSSGHA